MRTYIKAYMSLNFGQIAPLTTELAALERLKNRCHHVISVDIDPIFFKLAGNKNMHNIMNEFEFRPDRTTDYGVSCPWASKKYPYRPYNGENGVSTFSLLFLIGSFWYFHVTRTSIKAWMSLNFLKWDLTLAHWTQVSDRCPLGYLFIYLGVVVWFGRALRGRRLGHAMLADSCESLKFRCYTSWLMGKLLWAWHLTQKDAPVLHNKMMSFLRAIKKAKNKKHRLICSDKHAYTDRMEGPRSALTISP